MRFLRRLSRKRISGDMRKVRENLEILNTVDLYFTRSIEDKLGKGLADNKNDMIYRYVG